MLAALTARYRDLDLAEDAFAEACLRAARTWPERGHPRNAAAWLYRVADRVAIDMLRARKARQRIKPDAGEPATAAEDPMSDEDLLIPDERLRLIFVCCHPALSREARVALTLRMVCGLATEEIAQAFLVPVATMAQRIVRAKNKVAEARIPFEIPRPDAWPARLDSVLSTLEVAYASAHADAAGAGRRAGFAAEILELTRVLADLLPAEEDALALAALVRYAEARRPARLDDAGAMAPLTEQDPTQWNRTLIDEADAYLRRAAELGPSGPRTLQAAIHSAWCGRRTILDPAPWRTVLNLYDTLLRLRDDPFVRLNRAVALAEVVSPEAALCEVDALDGAQLAAFPPYHAVRADLLARSGRTADARAAYDALLALPTSPAERLWLERKRESLAG
ncbi:RNA polymerase sigma factor [Phenylobacterium montanum]|uniref:RNA polymerase sigma factor n=1 Tax=Phenylobacterium montanum TaxID=2823693 RepID=UPI002011B486|nr:sigma-70 family RNA polymerase sigma factor [Caulobacter sp. S6]